MDLRARLAIIFFILLVLPFVAVSAFQINRTMRVMVDDLGESGELIANQAFEEIRQDLPRSISDPVAAIRSDGSLKALLESSQAFGNGVVYARVDGTDGAPIAASQGAPAANASAPPFNALLQKLTSWWPPTRFAAVWGDHTYEISRVVRVGDHPLATIRVGLSTALIAAEARRSVDDILAAGAVGVVLSLIGAMLAGGLLLKPLAAIVTGVEQIAEGREQVNLKIDGRDELGTKKCKRKVTEGK